MRTEAPLFWHQGLFLQPQHFQLQELAARSHLVPLLVAQGPHFWGVVSIEFDRTALLAGTCRLNSGRFLFDDATYIAYPGNAIVASRYFPSAPPGERPPKVFLGVRRWNPSGRNVTVVKSRDEVVSVSTRFVALEEPEVSVDFLVEGPDAQVRRLYHVLRFFSEDERDAMAEYAAIPLGWPAGSSDATHGDFIPPALSLASSPLLLKLSSGIRDTAASWIDRLGEGKPKLLMQCREGGRPLVLLLVLAALNRYLPLFTQYLEAPFVHPSLLYGALRQLLGELTSYSSRRSSDLEKLPPYDHGDLWGCFSSGAALCSGLLAEIAGGPDQIIPLVHDGTYYSADLASESVTRGRSFYLAVTADQIAELMDGRVDVAAKLASRNRLPILTSHALPGVPLSHLASPPDEIPPEQGTVYFAVDHLHEQWETIAREGSIAFCWPDAPAGLQVRLLVVEGR
ncbi:type VI secretion system baseplate subunit TssK [Geomonas sp. Red32]|uniref:type VI secretion system baseplate subunit TssK n=1 Tax=Geomonas sp. Red32 TaxID=2912856 RepID=UPI00202CB170|nr:type VI secretion system baseplate subunit TssK [Geomonas sp. Red32]MCM0082089.1 type VI secretion system baseplate subunit TssK [Geomonas sp. Red32]